VLASQPASGAKKPQTVTDTVTIKADSVPLTGVPPSAITKALTSNEISWKNFTKTLNLASLPNLPQCVTNSIDENKNYTADPNTAYVIHIAQWSKDNPPQLESSTWSAYSGSKNNPDALIRKLDETGNPLIFRKKNALIIGLDLFDDKGGSGSLSIQYKSSVTQGTPQNVQNLGQLVTSLLGISTANAKAEAAPVLIAVACQSGTDHLPFTLNVVETIGIPASQKPADGTNPPPGQTVVPVPDALRGDNEGVNASQFGVAANTNGRRYVPPQILSSPRISSPQLVVADYDAVPSRDNSDAQTSPPSEQSQDGNGGQQPGDAESKDQKPKNQAGNSSSQSPQAGQADCTVLTASKNCTITRTFTFLDPEWWDISLAQSIPGVKESQYSISNSTLQVKTTTHADLYAFFDVDPAAYFLTKNTVIPHFAVGLPVAGKTFYRPFFGISQNLTGPLGLDKIGFPVHMNVFAGVVYMKTTRVTGNPTTTSELTADSSTARVTKWIFGAEVPLSALISKVGKGSKSSSKSSNSNGTTGTTEANQGTTASQ
jgi:hypothetical protein